MFSLTIPDISFYQNNPNTPAAVDFNKMKTAGVAGVIIRAGQGGWIDRDFVDNWKAAKAAGLLRGTYWLYDSRKDPNDQAALFLGVVNRDLPELGYWADLEENYGGSWAGWPNWKKFLTALRSARSNVGIYTAPYYWKDNMPAGASDLAFFGSFPLWIANYGVAFPDVPHPWVPDDLVFWQYTSKGDGPKYGVESLNIDLNTFNGSPEDFSKRFGVVPPDNGGTVTVKYQVVWPNGAAKRTGPSVTFLNVGTNNKDAVVDVIEENIPDSSDPTNTKKVWVKFPDGTYSARVYPDSMGVPQVRMVKVDTQTAPQKIAKAVLYDDQGNVVAELFPGA